MRIGSISSAMLWSMSAGGRGRRRQVVAGGDDVVLAEGAGVTAYNLLAAPRQNEGNPRLVVARGLFLNIQSKLVHR
jgi:hypothetical protein